MKLKSLISLIFADEKKGHLIIDLLELCSEDKNIENFLYSKTNNKNESNYLNDLYKYQINGGDIKIKLMTDMINEVKK